MINRNVFKTRQTLPLDAICNVDEQGSHLLHYAARAGLPKLVSFLITAGSDTNVFIPTPDEPQTGEPQKRYNRIPKYMRCWGTPMDMARLERQRNKEAKERKHGGTSPEGNHFLSGRINRVYLIDKGHTVRFFGQLLQAGGRNSVRSQRDVYAPNWSYSRRTISIRIIEDQPKVVAPLRCAEMFMKILPPQRTPRSNGRPSQ